MRTSSGGNCVYIRGDINNNGAANGIDVVFGVNYFKIDSVHTPTRRGEANLRRFFDAVLVGSGVTAENIATFADADGFIVGSWLKKDGDWTSPLDPARLEALVRAFRALPPR